jgi:hypothetical protein
LLADVLEEFVGKGKEHHPGNQWGRKRVSLVKREREGLGRVK